MTTPVDETVKFNVIPTHPDAERARVAALKKFKSDLKDFGRDHLVTDAALSKWYAPKPRKNRAAMIRDEFGPAESIWLERAS